MEIIKVLGTVAMDPKGEYDSSAYYEKLNTVLYNDSTYMAIKPSNNVLPTDTNYWQLIGGGTKKEDTTLIFDTVADMKEADLKEGYTVQTLGYYEVNDGGGDLYKIRTKTVSDTIDEMFIIELEDDNLIAELIVKNEVSIKQIGCQTNTDISSKLTAALAKVKKIYINEGTYLISTLVNIGSDKEIYGSANSNLQSTNVQIFKISGNCYIHDLNFLGQGNRTANCIEVENTQNTYKVVLKNLYIHYYKNGIDNNGYDTVIESCNVSTCAEDGILNRNTSPKISNCKLYNCRNGIKTTFGPMLLENCKMFLNKQSGIYLDNASNCVITNCVLQQNEQYGLYLYGDNNQIINCHSYANNTSDGDYGTLFLRGNNNKIEMTSVPFYSFWSAAEKHILCINNGTYSFNDINIKTDTTQGDMPVDFTPVDYIDRITGNSNINIDIFNLIKGGLLPTSISTSGNGNKLVDNSIDYVLMKSNVTTSVGAKLTYTINDAVKYFGVQAFANRKEVVDAKTWVRIESQYTDTSNNTKKTDLYYGNNDAMYNKIKSGKLYNMQTIREAADYGSDLKINVYLYTTGYSDTIAWKYYALTYIE